MITIRVVAAILAGLMLSACQTPYVAPSGKAKAELSIKVSSDSVGHTSMGHRVEVFKNLQCEPSPYGQEFGKKIFTKSGEIYAFKEIVANEPFTFVTAYMESRLAQNRECHFTASFIPEANHRYFADFKTLANVGYCEMRLFDESFDPPRMVLYETPERSCRESASAGLYLPNGSPLDLNWKVTVMPMPSK